MWVLWSKIYFIKAIFKNVMKWGLKGGFQLMQILDLLGMYFDAVVVFITKSSLLYRLAVVILWSRKNMKRRMKNTLLFIVTALVDNL